MRAWKEGLNFHDLVTSDPTITSRVPRKQIEHAFDLQRQLRNVDKIFARVFRRRRSVHHQKRLRRRNRRVELNQSSCVIPREARDLLFPSDAHSGSFGRKERVLKDDKLNWDFSSSNTKRPAHFYEGRAAGGLLGLTKRWSLYVATSATPGPERDLTPGGINPNSPVVCGL